MAKPTLFLEDLFVVEGARRSGAGGLLLAHVHALGDPVTDVLAIEDVRIW